MNGGYVYLLKEVNGIHYKIGRSKDPHNRLKAFGVKLPFEVEFEVLIETDNMYFLEAILHEQYKKKRVGGEWFKLTAKDVAAIKRIPGAIKPKRKRITQAKSKQIVHPHSGQFKPTEYKPIPWGQGDTRPR